MRLGVKTNWRDASVMAALADRFGARVLEYQMLPGDLEEHRGRVVEAFAPLRERFGLRVHQPEAYVVDGERRFLDPAHRDPARRREGARVLAGVVDLAFELGAEAAIVHPGGVWIGPEPGGDPDLLAESLRAVRETDAGRSVPLLLENMPAHYDMRAMEGRPQGVPPAAFRIPEGLLRLDALVDGYCLDVSHAYLAVPGGTLEVPRAFVRDMAPRIRHVHANGSRGGVGAAGEGTPFSDSDYGVEFVGELLARLEDDVVVVPEIMEGHLDQGRRFEEGLAALATLGVFPPRSGAVSG